MLPGLGEKKAKRKTFVAREDLVDRLSDVARDRGYSLYAFVNEVFGLFLRAEEMGLDLRRILEERGVLESAKRAGFVLGLENLWYDMADLAYEKARGKAVKSWFDAGVWFAKRYAASGGEDSLTSLVDDLRTLMWNVQELNVERNGDKVSVKVLSPRFSEAYTSLFSAFLEGCLESLGYKRVNQEVFKGRIFIEAIK